MFSLVLGVKGLSDHLSEILFESVLCQTLYLEYLVSDHLPLATTFMKSCLSQFSVKHFIYNLSLAYIRHSSVNVFINR